MRSVNRTIWGLSASVGDPEQVAFFCESRAANCYAPALLSLASFDTLVAAQKGWVLVPGHHPPTPWMLGDAVS
jgi:hypothetical protein